ncbi:Ca2+/Na+ antiporter [Flavobacterium gossypii]|uniref:Ca2+/Na+ antiporter n=1 Tax=Flavobacterium gossypii TaxID=1646119 RepID=A0ABR6DSY1_9FLAO|nr:Ca2+/Na+ antiporter [Flavobacterium gossypii]
MIPNDDPIEEKKEKLNYKIFYFVFAIIIVTACCIYYIEQEREKALKEAVSN